MPIYAYRCAACGHAKDVLQKMSDAPLADCPACGAPRFEKQVTAAGFQLKGSGWYVTDFRDSGKSKKSEAPKTDDKAAATSVGNGEAKAAEAGSSATAAPAPASVAPAPAAPTPAPEAPGPASS